MRRVEALLLARVLQEDLSHEQIDETSREPGAYTDAVDAFLKSLR